MQRYELTRARVGAYFDATAQEAWTRLTSDAPVSRIRATVRAGRDAMRRALLDALPADLTGARVLDAGAGPGQMAIALAERGARVLAVDLSPNLIAVARERTPAALAARIEYRAGDMLDPELGSFDHVVSMDCLIHYSAADAVAALARLAARTREGLHFTVAPRTPALTAMHWAGQFFPRSDRSPAIQPVSLSALDRAVALEAGLRAWRLTPGPRIATGFYISQAMELVPR